MPGRGRRAAMLAVAALVGAAMVEPADVLAQETPLERAVAFLAVEVPQWRQENGCYSCHNNGDAARALVAAKRAGLLADGLPLADTFRFLSAPADWDSNGPDGPFKDKKLARIQFAAALADAAQAGDIDNPRALATAANLVAEMQSPDGSWQIDAAGNIGSPATYGQSLASALALRTLEAAPPGEHQAALGKARHWFETREPKNVLDAAATLLALADQNGKAAAENRRRALAIIRTGQSDVGGWGPFVNAPPEVFDTAMVLLALAAQRDVPLSDPIAKGRKYLVERQADDGGWPPTTRPPGADSYAQRLSTTGWATLALLATRDDNR